MPWQFSVQEGGGFGRRGVAKEAVDRRALGEPAVVEEQDLVAEALGLAEVVRDQHDLGAGGVDRGDHRLDLARRRRVEARRRLVEEQHLGREHPRAGQREALLLAAGEHARRMVGETGQSDAGQRRERALVAPVPRHAGELKREAQVAQHRAAEQHRPLEHHRLPARCARDLRRAPAHAARRGREQAVADAQQHALARAVGAEDHAARPASRASG